MERGLFSRSSCLSIYLSCIFQEPKLFLSHQDLNSLFQFVLLTRHLVFIFCLFENLLIFSLLLLDLLWYSLISLWWWVVVWKYLSRNMQALAIFLVVQDIIFSWIQNIEIFLFIPFYIIIGIMSTSCHSLQIVCLLGIQKNCLLVSPIVVDWRSSSCSSL